MKIRTSLLLMVATITSTAKSAGCPYAAQAGHCCNGSIYRSEPSGNLDDPNTWTCCQGASPSVSNSHGTCASGNAISLVDAPTVDGGAGSSASSAAASVSVVTQDTTTTSSVGMSPASASGSASGTPNVSPSAQSSSNAANGLMTDTSVFAGVLIAGGVALTL